MKMKNNSTWKRHQFCGGPSVFGTQCYIDESTEFVHCSCGKELKGFDWTIIFYLFKMVHTEKIHLVDRYSKPKNNRTQDQVWQDFANRFNTDMNFVTDEDRKNGGQLKDFLVLACGKLINLTYEIFLVYYIIHILVGYVQKIYFNPTDFIWKKDVPPVAELARKIMEEKDNQTKSQSLKRQHEKDKKQRLEDTMLGFTDSILPTADGCHPSITIGTQSQKIRRFDTHNPLRRDTLTTTTDGDTMITMPSIDDDLDDDDEEEDESTAPFAPEVDEDGTKHFTTVDGRKTLSYKKNAPQNGKLYRFSCN